MRRRGAARIVLVAWTVGLLAGVVAVPPAASASLRTVSSGNYFFADDATGSRSEIRVDVGDQIRVTHTGPGRHTVDVDELGIHSGAFTDGQSFTTPPLDTPGTFRFYCDTHEGRGHLTTLVVVGQAPPPPEPTPEPTPTPTPTPAPAPAPAPTATRAPAPSPTATATSAPASTTPASTTPSESASPATSPTSPTSSDPPSTSDPADPAQPARPAGATSDDTPGGTTDQDDDGIVSSGIGGGSTGGGGAAWTRAIWLALVGLVPMVGAVGWSLAGHGRGPGASPGG